MTGCFCSVKNEMGLKSLREFGLASDNAPGEGSFPDGGDDDGDEVGEDVGEDCADEVDDDTGDCVAGEEEDAEETEGVKFEFDSPGKNVGRFTQ